MPRPSAEGAGQNGVRGRQAACSPLSPARRRQLLRDTLSRAPDPGDLRVFAYGSLMWNPCFQPAGSEPVVLDGYQRRFCILTVRARGTPECPGLGLGLVPGRGACRGIAYRLDARTLERDLEALFEREMNTGVYRPTWVKAANGDRPVDALTFVADPSHPQYVGDLEPAEMVDLIVEAKGSYGSCRDYLASMVASLERHGGAEREFRALLRAVDARLAGAGNG